MLSQFAFCICDKHYDEKQVVEERAYLTHASGSQFSTEGSYGGHTGEDRGWNNRAMLLTGSLQRLEFSSLSYTALAHLPRDSRSRVDGPSCISQSSRKCLTDVVTGQSDGGSSLFEDPSCHMYKVNVGD